MNDDLSPDTQRWLAEHATGQPPSFVMARALILGEAEDRRADRARAKVLAEVNEAAAERGWLMERSGGVAECGPGPMMRRLAALSEIESRETERQHEIDVAERRARNMEYAMSRGGARTHEEILAGAALWATIADAHEARRAEDDRQAHRAAVAARQAEFEATRAAPRRSALADVVSVPVAADARSVRDRVKAILARDI